jgi:hypothetical protein
MVYKIIPSNIDLNQIMDDCINLIDEVGFQDNILQIGLQIKDIDNPDWYESCGSIYKLGKLPIIEPLFKHIHPALKNSEIEKWLNSFEFPVFRARLMKVLPRQCYSIHKDPYPRIHLPVKTNESCLMIFPSISQIVHFPAEGKSFWVDTRIDHTFINCSMEERIHLVAVTSQDFSS